MKDLRYTLISDGPSDQALLPILNWLLQQSNFPNAIQPEWADLRRLPNPPSKLQDRIRTALNLFPCDLLFIHRDAERESYQSRFDEITDALANLNHPEAVCVIPIRMQEAWLLFDEIAIRKAAGNPNGKQPLSLPTLNSLENLPNPKEILHGLILEATGLGSHRQRKFNVSASVYRVPEFINDFSPLRNLSAFQLLENQLNQIIRNNFLEIH